MTDQSEPMVEGASISDCVVAAENSLWDAVIKQMASDTDCGTEAAVTLLTALHAAEDAGGVRENPSTDDYELTDEQRGGFEEEYFPSWELSDMFED